MTKSVTVVDHPLVQHKLTLLRRKEASTSEFRTLLREIGLFLGYEALRDLPLGRIQIETPVCTMEAPVLAGKKLTFISVLRAGDGLLGPMLELVPSARVGQIGLARDEETLMPTKYFFKVPQDTASRVNVILDPMLATGHSAIRAVQEIKDAGAKDVRFVCLLAAPEGLKALTEAHPDVPIITAAIDEKLNEKAYIVPGLGDAGDRLFGTKGV
ncbi:uracil phosphoribosyltransferase [Kordiimonas pumila]|uniref:Uracil phosphoribosyltransferase n=1 Tax=Kordiimonas pumila TaxID=2161677 RepID=A0ABV7D8G6_9PROT|nr:uracil phosphoribosyltransferase [Kordiimonas pumila]